LTEEYPNFKEMVERDRKRRAEDGDYRPALWFLYADRPGALTDVDEAVNAIVKAADNFPPGIAGHMVIVSPSILMAVQDALSAAHPRLLVLSEATTDAHGRLPLSPWLQFRSIKRIRDNKPWHWAE
jgi:hypothetical protein